VTNAARNSLYPQQIGSVVLSFCLRQTKSQLLQKQLPAIAVAVHEAAKTVKAFCWHKKACRFVDQHKDDRCLKKLVVEAKSRTDADRLY
jgi:hypothetical protein